MNTANWLQLLGTIVLLAITWGKQVEKQSEKTAEDFAKSRNGQGIRIGGVEERLARLEGALDAAPAAPASRPRPRTRPIPIAADGDT